MMLVYALVVASQTAATPPASTLRVVETIVQQIRRADYADDRPGLKRLRDELEPFLPQTSISARVRYWRGFAMWRRALNGFNDGADRNDLAQDLSDCVGDFRAAVAVDPAFADAKAGEASCLVNHSFLIMKTEPARARAMFEQSKLVLDDALASASDNPRVLWVYGANQFYSPTPEGKALAIATYERGLRLARAQKRGPVPSMDPEWGEPELLMNLAFANLKKAQPDVSAAARYAEQALMLVPYWHYVRDVLLPSIRTASR